MRRRTIYTPEYFNSVTVAAHSGVRPVDRLPELIWKEEQLLAQSSATTYVFIYVYG